MSMTCAFYCDMPKCTNAETSPISSTPIGWKEIKLEWGQYQNKRFLLCPDCLPKVGIYENQPAPHPAPTEDHIADKLLALLEEIAQSVVEENK